MGFSRQEYWSGLSFPFLGDLLDPGIEPGSPALQADALPSEPPGTNVKKFTVNLLGKKHQELQEHSSLGFSRQEHWSGLPFPSPMHESEK